MKLMQRPGMKRTHAAPAGVALCGARLDAAHVVELENGQPSCPACRSVLADRGRRRERREGGGGFDPFVQVKLVRNARGQAQYEVTVPYGSTQRMIDETHELAVREYRRLEQELGPADWGAEARPRTQVRT